MEKTFNRHSDNKTHDEEQQQITDCPDLNTSVAREGAYYNNF